MFESGIKKVGFFPRVLGFRVPDYITNAVTMDENGICPPETPDCMTGLPKCEKNCQDDSCVYVPIPRCEEIRISKQVLWILGPNHLLI